MNILPKKSWHVRTKKNIERVRRDEVEAERLVSIECNRQLRAEQEARVRELRIRAGIHDDEGERHIDLFQNYQEAQQTSNPEYEAEKRHGDDARKVRASFSSSLIRPQDVSKPWYCADSSDMPKVKHSNLITSIYDPMTAIKNAEQIVKNDPDSPEWGLP